MIHAFCVICFDSFKLRAMRAEITSNFHIEYSHSGSGAPIVLLHAFPLNNQMWRAQIEALQQEYSCYAPSARGFGGTSPFESTPSIEQMAHDVNALLDALHISEPIVLCGLSMGGYAALNFARLYPERLQALVLCDTRAEADSDEAREKRNANIEFVQQHDAAALVERVLPTLLGETTQRENPSLVEQVKGWGRAAPVSTLAAALEALRDRPDVTTYLAQIKVPTLLIFGEEDALAPAEAIEKLEREIPNSKLVTIPHAGHLSNLENPQAFNAALVEFVHSLG
jgi:pimeloyl-ACP methyl ester carboxylesterase